ncbi:MAG: helix-turn-helix transcriptional regulator [Clostridia bacterium]|nr:helix-turn-helix transcriptional regulator [Clostridia bacterium]
MQYNEKEWIDLAREEAKSRTLYEKINDLNDDTFIWKKHAAYAFYTHFHAAVEICFMINGERAVTIGEHSFVLKEGEACLINPFEVHTYHHNPDASKQVATIILSKNYLNDFHQVYGDVVLPNYLTDVSFNKQLLALFDDVPPSLSSNQTLTPLTKKAYANLLFDKIATRYSVQARDQQSDIATKIVLYICNNYTQKISLDTLAKEFNYTKTSISRILSKYLHTDLRCFVNNWRAEQAEAMLNDQRYAQHSVTQIALLCGFDSTATFYRAYKRRYGRLPREN